jgi:hypothetical protein
MLIGISHNDHFVASRISERESRGQTGDNGS